MSKLMATFDHVANQDRNVAHFLATCHYNLHTCTRNAIQHAMYVLESEVAQCMVTTTPSNRHPHSLSN